MLQLVRAKFAARRNCSGRDRITTLLPARRQTNVPANKLMVIRGIPLGSLRQVAPAADGEEASQLGFGPFDRGTYWPVSA